MLDGELDFSIEGTPRFIIDAGANIGLASVRFAVRFPGATIVALEVDESNFRILELNTRPYPSILPRHLALWSGPALLSLSNPSGREDSVQVTATSPLTGRGVPALGVIDILAEAGVERVDILKLDIEGAEVEVLSQGAEEWLGRVGVLVVELHDRLRAGCSEALDACLSGRAVRRERHGEYTIIRQTKKP